MEAPFWELFLYPLHCVYTNSFHFWIIRKYCTHSNTFHIFLVVLNDIIFSSLIHFWFFVWKLLCLMESKSNPHTYIIDFKTLIFVPLFQNVFTAVSRILFNEIEWSILHEIYNDTIKAYKPQVLYNHSKFAQRRYCVYNYHFCFRFCGGVFTINEKWHF